MPQPRRKVKKKSYGIIIPQVAAIKNTPAIAGVFYQNLYDPETLKLCNWIASLY